jgi:hypothetical protein
VSFRVNTTRIPGDNDEAALGYLFATRVCRAQSLARRIARTADPDRAEPEQAAVALVEEDRRSLSQTREDRWIAPKAQKHRVDTARLQRLSLAVDVIPLVSRELLVEMVDCLRSLLAELTGKAARAVPVTHDSQREAERVHA